MPPKGGPIEAAALLKHVDALENQLPPAQMSFGHPDPPKLFMCKVPHPDKRNADYGVVSMMAVTKRCVSAQLFKEGNVAISDPVEVLVLPNDDEITASTLFALELPELSAEDTLIVQDQGKNANSGMVSLMKGGMKMIAPAPRVAIVVGTALSRVVSIEFSVKLKTLQLVRRNHMVGKQVFTYFEPLPLDQLTDQQKEKLKKGQPAPQRRASMDSSMAAVRIKGPVVPFEPTGGVKSITPYSLGAEREKTHVWIAFGDGTAVRAHHAGFFPSVIQKHTDSSASPPPLEQVLDDELVRCQARLPNLPETEVTVVPLPKYHPSPLAHFPTLAKPNVDENDDDDASPVPSGPALIPDVYEAMLFCKGAMADAFPTISFYTSEVQIAGRMQGDDMEEKKTDDDGNIIGAVVGGILGLFGGGGKKDEKKEEQPIVREEEQPEEWDPRVPFPSMNYDALPLYAGYEIHDSPRQVTFVTVDPEGDLAAVADTLGRITLVDLTTKQVIRMWKGFRDSSCHWLQVPHQNKEKPWARTKILYLVIHSRQRRVVEVWRTRHGPKILSLQVGREAQIMSCREMSVVGFISTCYLAHSNAPGSSMNQVERIQVEETEDEDGANVKTKAIKRSDAVKLSQDAAVRLNHLQQLLGDTNVQCRAVDVFKALENIKSIKDLATAMDVIAEAPTLEEKMGIKGAEFQRLVIAHCRDRFDEAVRDGGGEAVTNPHVQLLAFKIAYFTQIVDAYEIVSKSNASLPDDEPTIEVAPKAGWAFEAASWTETYEKVTGKSVDDDILDTPEGGLKFHTFAKACTPPKDWLEAPPKEDGTYQIYLSDSTRTRQDLLLHIFKPLLGDIFAFNSTHQLFEVLDLKDDNDYKLKCFGEWFMSLSVHDSTKKARFSGQSALSRWLQEILTLQFDIDEVATKNLPLKSLHSFCKQADDLPRAFWLACVCRESVYQVAKSKEEKTYGKVLADACVYKWDVLLRQLRVCLFASLRLNGVQLGACPISIANIEEEGNFSIFEWLARDELAMSHKQVEIVSLEHACKNSSHSFDPSTKVGDDPSKFKVLQNACLSMALTEDEKEEYLVDFDDDERFGALLLYLKPHINEDALLAHRALLLGAKWGATPKDLSILEDAIAALRAMKAGTENKAVASAVRLEIWQSRVRPVFRALLMGFNDVQEVSSEVMAPLFHDDEWVGQFGKHASTLLTMISEMEWDSLESPNDYLLEIKKDNITWPPVRDDFILKRLVQKNRQPIPSSLAAHRVLMIAMQISRNMSVLSQSIPSFYDLFTPGALFSAVSAPADLDENQHAFMQDAIVEYARKYNGPSLDTLDLGEIDELAKLWDFDLNNVRTLFLLSMYEFGKDRLVDELLTKSSSLISAHHFCDDGVDIVCRRLNDLLHLQEREDVRKVMGQLDAEMCEWIRERAEKSEPLVHGNLDVPVGNTHLFALRLLSLAATADISKEERVKIHSLIVLNGTLVKALEEPSSQSKKTTEKSDQFLSYML